MKHVRRNWTRLAALALCAGGTSWAQPCGTTCTTTIPGGPVSGTWDAAGSPYCVEGDITIGDLTIQPGVCVLVDGPFRIDVAVRLRVLGTAALPVTITSRDPQARWHGIVFTDLGPGSELNWCTVSRSDTSGLRINSGAGPILRDCTITDNSKTGNGGGIEANITIGVFQLDRCRITGNTSAVHGPGLRASMSAGSQLVMHGCTVSNNAAGGPVGGGTCVGGGLYLSGSADLVGCMFDGNSCQTGGGGMVAYGSGLYVDGGGTAHVQACAFTGGLAHSFFAYGRGAIFIAGGSTLNIESSVVACNSVTGGAPATGGIWVESGQATITNCTIARNTSFGLTRNGGGADVRNSILYYNNLTSAGPPPVYGAQLSGTGITLAYCDVQGGVQPGDGNISVNPGFEGPGCCAQAYTLFDVSPCVDAGDPALLDGCRLPGRGGARSDIGAFGGPGNCPWGPVQLCYPDCDGSCSLNVLDFTCFLNKFAAQDPYANCDGSSTAPTLNVLDFFCFLNRFAAGCT